MNWFDKVDKVLSPIGRLLMWAAVIGSLFARHYELTIVALLVLILWKLSDIQDELKARSLL